MTWSYLHFCRAGDKREVRQDNRQLGWSKMLDSGESHKEEIRPEVNRAIMLDFQGAKSTSAVIFLPGEMPF